MEDSYLNKATPTFTKLHEMYMTFLEKFTKKDEPTELNTYEVVSNRF